jgi:predicted  nucleic acid-binding Zn-ribbon protein
MACPCLEFITMKHLPFLHVLLVSLSFSLVSCDRQKQLLREKERLDAEYMQASTEIQAIEQRTLSLGTQVANATVNMERQTVAAEQKAAFLQSEVNGLEDKVRALEEAAKEYSSKVDAYKAKYLR